LAANNKKDHNRIEKCRIAKSRKIRNRLTATLTPPPLFTLIEPIRVQIQADNTFNTPEVPITTHLPQAHKPPQ